MIHAIIVDDYGVPSSLMGTHHKDFFALLGRIVALSASLENHVLVSCRVDSFAVAGDRFEDAFGGLGPDVRARVLVPGLDPGADVGVQGADGLVGAAAQLLVGQLREPSLDEVDPRAAGGGEVQVKAGVGDQPSLDLAGFVGRAVVEHDVDIEVAGDLAVDRLQELVKLERPVAVVQLADHHPGREIQGGVEAGGAVALVVVVRSGRRAREHRQSAPARG
jgi:hypothetical protein